MAIVWVTSVTTLEAHRASRNSITSAEVEVLAEERNSALLLLPPASLANLPSRDPLGRLASRDSVVKQEDNGDVATAGRDIPAPAGVRWQMNVQEDVLDLALLRDERGDGISSSTNKVRFQILALLCEHEAADQGILEAFRFMHVTQKEAKD
jgi:hypothetical protein